MPTLFLAPTAREARRAAWDFLRGQRATSAATVGLRALWLDPPLIFSAASGAPAWRDLAREGAGAQTTPAPRLIRAEAFFARAYAALSRQRALAGADRLWVLQSAARRALASSQNVGVEEELSHLLHSRDALQGAAHCIANLRRAHWTRFPEAPGSEALNALLEAYDARLDALGAFDFEAAPALFPLAAARNRAFAWPQMLVVDDLMEISPALQIGLAALLERAAGVAATLVGSDETDEALAGALEFWQARGALPWRVGNWNTRGARVTARILGGETPVEAPENLFLTPAHTRRDEMERIAAHIRAALEAGARPDDFTLGCADFARYEADARHAFARHGVPLDWPVAPPLLRSPLVRALLCALDSPAQKLNVHVLHDLFGDGTLRWSCDHNGEPKSLDARRLRAAALAARHPELDDLEATRLAFERKRALLTAEARHDDAPARTAIETALAAGDLGFVAGFQELRARFQESCTASVWHAHVLEMASRLAAHWLEGEPGAAARARDDLARFLEAAETVANRARGWDDAEHETSRDAREWMDWLHLEIESGAPREAETPRGGVAVGGLEAAIGGARATFWCGLSEGAWPRAEKGNAATRELEQILAAHRASPLARATHHLARAAGENAALYLSHARFLDGQETPASPLLDDLSAAFPDADWPPLAPASTLDAATRRGMLCGWNRWFSAGNGSCETAALPLEAQKQLQTLARMRAARRGVEIGVYDGVLGARGRELMVVRDQNKGARWSGSDLEFYARCPLRYFFERVLELRHPEREGDDIDARAAGTLVHQIAHLWVRASQPALQSGDFAAGLALLAEIARAECQKLPIRPILREAEWHRLMGCDGASGPLVAWVRLEMALGSGAWGVPMRPISQSATRVESLGDGLEHRFEIELGGHAIKGFIDRIDSSEDGAHLAVIDYKTGDIAGLPVWKNGDGGLHFQLAIYALAVRKLALQDETAAPRLAMAYLSLKRAKIARGIGQEGTLGRGCSGGKSLEDAAFDAWLDDVSARAARIGDLRAGGVFNLTLQAPKDAKCATCASKTLCGQHLPTQVARFETHQGSPFVYLPLLRPWEV